MTHSLLFRYRANLSILFQSPAEGLLSVALLAFNFSFVFFCDLLPSLAMPSSHVLGVNLVSNFFLCPLERAIVSVLYLNLVRRKHVYGEFVILFQFATHPLKLVRHADYDEVVTVDVCS